MFSLTKIQELLQHVATLGADDWFIISIPDVSSPTGYVSRKVNKTAFVKGSIYEDDGTLTGNRIVNGNFGEMTFADFDQFIIEIDSNFDIANTSGVPVFTVNPGGIVNMTDTLTLTKSGSAQSAIIFDDALSGNNVTLKNKPLTAVRVIELPDESGTVALKSAFSGTGAFTNFTIVDGIITNAT